MRTHKGLDVAGGVEAPQMVGNHPSSFPRGYTCRSIHAC